MFLRCSHVDLCYLTHPFSLLYGIPLWPYHDWDIQYLMKRLFSFFTNKNEPNILEHTNLCVCANRYIYLEVKILSHSAYVSSALLFSRIVLQSGVFYKLWWGWGFPLFYTLTNRDLSDLSFCQSVGVNCCLMVGFICNHWLFVDWACSLCLLSIWVPSSDSLFSSFLFVICLFLLIRSFLCSGYQSFLVYMYCSNFLPASDLIITLFLVPFDESNF